jgi:hypothetical protein
VPCSARRLTRSRQVGPFVYRAYTEKFNLTWSEDYELLRCLRAPQPRSVSTCLRARALSPSLSLSHHAVAVRSFKTRSWYEFVPEESVASDEEPLLYVAHPLACTRDAGRALTLATAAC